MTERTMMDKKAGVENDGKGKWIQRKRRWKMNDMENEGRWKMKEDGK